MTLGINNKLSNIALCLGVIFTGVGNTFAANTTHVPVAKSITKQFHSGEATTVNVSDIAQDQDGDTLYIDQVAIDSKVGKATHQTDDSVTLTFYEPGRQTVDFVISDSQGDVLDTTTTFSVDVLSDKQLHRFLNQATFGPTHQLMEQAATFDPKQWLHEQFDAPVSSHEAKYFEFGGNDHAAHDDAWMDIAVYGEDQLRQRVAFALSEVFVVSRYGTLYERPRSLVNYYDTLTYDAFGNFRKLIEDVSLHPAMGSYLTMTSSKEEDPDTGSQPDENYAREIMQLFTIGLNKLNTDGSIRTDESGKALGAYTQDDITNVAKAFTGWRHQEGDTNHVLPMVADNSVHDQSEKVIMGHTLPAGQTAEQDMQDVLDILYNHPNTPPFFAKHMIKRLVTSNPSPEYIERVANVFIDNGEGIRGDLQAVIEAILLDKEALGEDPEHMPVKIKEPIIAVVNLYRALDLKLNSDHFVNSDIPFWRIGQGPLRADSVFNFYSQDYSPAGTDLFAPELEIMTWPTFITTFNYMRTFTAKWRDPLLPNYKYFQGAGDDMDELMRRIGLVFFGRSVDPNLELALREHTAFLRGKPKNAWVIEELMEFVIAYEDFYVQD
ncbi:DUF1800 domain-containing protein [Vibrio sp. AK197]